MSPGHHPGMADVPRQRRRGIDFVLASAVGVLSGAGVEASGGAFFGEPWHWGEMALRVVLFAVLVPPSWWLARRAVDRGWLSQHPAARDRDRRLQLLAPVLRSGALPPDIDPDAWRRGLRDTARELNALRWCWLVSSAVIAALTAVAAVVANDDAWSVWAVAVLVAVNGSAGFVLAGRRRRTALRLRKELSAVRSLGT